MRRYRIVAQFTLILSIFNLVLAAPIMVQEMHEARGDETAVSEDVAAVPDAAAPPHPSSSESSEKPAVAEDVAAWPGAVAPPHPSDSGPLQIPAPPQLPPEWEIFRDWHLQRWLQGLPPSHPSSSEPSEKPAVAEDVAAIGMPDALASPHTLSSGYHSELDEPVPSHDSTPQRLASPSRYLTLGVSPPSSTLPAETAPDNAGFYNRNPPTGTSTDNAEFFNRNMIKKLKIVTGVIAAGGIIIGGIVGSQVKHKHHDSQDG